MSCLSQVPFWALGKWQLTKQPENLPCRAGLSRQKAELILLGLLGTCPSVLTAALTGGHCCHSPGFTGKGLRAREAEDVPHGGAGAQASSFTSHLCANASPGAQGKWEAVAAVSAEWS